MEDHRRRQGARYAGGQDRRGALSVLLRSLGMYGLRLGGRGISHRCWTKPPSSTLPLKSGAAPTAILASRWFRSVGWSSAPLTCWQCLVRDYERSPKHGATRYGKPATPVSSFLNRPSSKSSIFLMCYPRTHVHLNAIVNTMIFNLNFWLPQIYNIHYRINHRWPPFSRRSDFFATLRFRRLRLIRMKWIYYR